MPRCCTPPKTLVRGASPRLSVCAPHLHDHLGTVHLCHATHAALLNTVPLPVRRLQPPASGQAPHLHDHLGTVYLCHTARCDRSLVESQESVFQLHAQRMLNLQGWVWWGWEVERVGRKGRRGRVLCQLWFTATGHRLPAQESHVRSWQNSPTSALEALEGHACGASTNL